MLIFRVGLNLRDAFRSRGEHPLSLHFCLKRELEKPAYADIRASLTSSETITNLRVQRRKKADYCPTVFELSRARLGNAATPLRIGHSPSSEKESGAPRHAASLHAVRRGEAVNAR